MASQNEKNDMRWRSRNKIAERTGTGLLLLKWLLPCFFAGFGFYIQSVTLHYATYAYVHKMLEIKEATPKKSWKPDVFETLEDPVEDSMGPRVTIKIEVLDKIAACFPATFVALALAKRIYTLQVWTKVMVCAGILFILKGTLGAMTTVPDSSGWDICEARLKPEGLSYMKEDHSFWEMFALDFQWNLFWYHHPLRYCADMMYSGHTFVVTLFALGCYELLRIVISAKEAEKKEPIIKLKIGCLCLLSFVAIGEQFLEIYTVLKSHFHYSTDVLMAIVVTFLLYTNGAIAVFSKQWELRGPYFLVASWPKQKANDEVSKADWRKLEMWVSRGDIFLPPCCIPCCCLSGRQHIYSDQDLEGIATSVDQWLKENDSSKDCRRETSLHFEEWRDALNVEEGVSMDDVWQVRVSMDDMWQGTKAREKVAGDEAMIRQQPLLHR